MSIFGSYKEAIDVIEEMIEEVQAWAAAAPGNCHKADEQIACLLWVIQRLNIKEANEIKEFEKNVNQNIHVEQ